MIAAKQGPGKRLMNIAIYIQATLWEYFALLLLGRWPSVIRVIADMGDELFGPMELCPTCSGLQL